MVDYQVKMTVKQIREIKPLRVIHLDSSWPIDINDWDILTTSTKAFRIHRVSGETIELDFSHYDSFNEGKKGVEGLPDDMELLVGLETYRQWEQTRSLQND